MSSQFLRRLLITVVVTVILMPWACVLAEFPSIPSVYVHYAADNPANIVIAPIVQEFSAEQVDQTNQKLSLPDLGFAPIVYHRGIGPATPVCFSTTGALPEPLTAATPYYIVPDPDGGYKVYSVATDADAACQPGGVPGEKVLPAQNVAQGVRCVEFTSAGTGTHTLYTKRLISQMTDMTENGYHAVAVNAKDKHTCLELDEDKNGNTFIRTAGATARENFVSSYNAYGQVFFQGPSDKRVEARQEVARKRVVYQVFVGRVRSFKERQVMKVMPSPADVSVSNDQIKYAVDHRMLRKLVTGDLLNAKAYEGSTLPAPLAEGVDYYARKIDDRHIALHPTAADAADDTNVIDITTPGSGRFMFWAPARVGDYRRWSFFAEILAPDSGGNTLSVRLQEPIPSSAAILKNATRFVVSGKANGNVAGLANLPELSQVSLWTPPRATLPAPLQSGVRYWVTKSPGSSSYGRLHETLASAAESVGVATDLSSCIKYTAPGMGEALVSYDDEASAIAFGTLSNKIEPFDTRVPLGPLCVLVFKVDYDDPRQPSVYATLGVNEAVTERKPLTLDKGLTPEAIHNRGCAWTMFNSAQGHVPIDLDCYEVVFGSSTDAVPDSDIQTIVDYLKAKYSIVRLLDTMAEHPDRYAEDIARFRDRHGAMLLDASQLARLRAAQRTIADVLGPSGN